MLLTKFAAGVDYWPYGVSLLIHHTVMGFTIGVSSLKMNWAAHGALWGALFGIFVTIRSIQMDNPFAIFIFIVIWGFLIEALATKAFKQPQ